MADSKAKKTTKKTVSPQKIVIEGDFVEFKYNGKHRNLKKDKIETITAEKAKLFLKAGWGEIAK